MGLSLVCSISSKKSCTVANALNLLSYSDAGWCALRKVARILASRS